MKISHKIGLFSILIALLPMLVVGIAGYVKGVELLTENQIKVTEQALVRAEEQIVKKVEEAKSIATILAGNIDVYGVEEGFRSFQGAVSQYKDFKNVFFGVEKTGEFLISPHTELPADYDPRKRPWYGIARDKAPVISRPYSNRA